MTDQAENGPALVPSTPEEDMSVEENGIEVQDEDHDELIQTEENNLKSGNESNQVDLNGDEEGTQNITERNPSLIAKEDISSTATEDPIEPAEDEDEDEDEDDFGDFSDASFDDFEEPSQEPEAPASQDPSFHNRDAQASIFPQEIFADEEKLNERLGALCREAFPRDLEKFKMPANTSILNERSTHLLERLVAQPYLKPYNWQRGSLRRQLLVTLGLPDDTLVQKERSNEFDMDSYVVRKLSELRIDADERKRLMENSEEEIQILTGSVLSEEQLAGMSEEELSETIEKLQKDVAKVERLLSVWDDEREKLEEDHRTYEGVVENLVGHTQRLRREETLKSLKKGKEKGRLGLFKRLTKN